VKRIIKEDERVKSIHDFHISDHNEATLIEFHAVVRADKLEKGKTHEDVRKELENLIESEIEDTKCRIILDIDF